MGSTFLGKCKGCKGCARIEAPVTNKRTAHLGYGRTETRYTRELPNGVRVEGYDRFFSTCLCGRHVEFRLLRGRVNDQKCGAKCMSSHGPVCECSCGGKNHGGSYAA